MVFLHINPKNSDNCEILDKHIESDDKKIFILIFMNGCRPCEATKPEWEKLEIDLDDDYKKDENIIIADLDQDLLSSIKNLPTQPKGFPTMLYISDKGNKYEEFDKGRGVEDFVDWIKTNATNETNETNAKIESHSKKHRGGKRRRSIYKNRNTRKYKSKKNTRNARNTRKYKSKKNTRNTRK
jgi:hypothetical protein